MTAVVKSEHVTRRLEGDVPVTLVNDVDIEIQNGEFIAISGPSGSGKSSLLYLLGLQDKPTSGKIFLNGKETSSLGEEALARLRLETLGFVFQFHFLLPEFSALENVMLPMQKLGRLSASKIKSRAEALLESLGLGDQKHKLPRQLSGGQSQRVAIARALANDPLLILADEPTGNLDTVAGANVQDIFRELTQGQGKAVAVVTHDTAFAEKADRRIVLVDGKIVK